MAGAVINARAQHPDRFKEFVQWYCGTIEQDCPKLTSIEHIHEFIQAALQFWNEEGKEGWPILDSIKQPR